MDVFDEINLRQSLDIPKEYVETIVKKIDDMYKASNTSNTSNILNRSKTEKAIQSVPFASKKWYNKPVQKEAAQIWDQCSFLGCTSETMIESGLWEWAITYGNAKEKGDTFEIEWSSSTTKYSAVWSAFFRWFLCACGPPV